MGESGLFFFSPLFNFLGVVEEEAYGARRDALMASDFALSVPDELESALRLKTVRFLITQRPWLDLYGVNVRPVAPFGSVSSKPYFDQALLHRILPDELLHEVFARMAPYDSGRASCVCRKWRYTIRNPVFWHNACLKAWQVCYYGYIRFYPSGKFLYKNSSQKIKDVAKYMNLHAAKAESVFKGHYTLADDKVEAAVLYPGLCPIVLRIRLRLRGTVDGANNRMDLLSLVVEGWEDDETHNPDVPAISHKRGLTPFVFVPLEEMDKSVLNLPVEKMDYYVPG